MLCMSAVLFCLVLWFDRQHLAMCFSLAVQFVCANERAHITSRHQQPPAPAAIKEESDGVQIGREGAGYVSQFIGQSSAVWALHSRCLALALLVCVISISIYSKLNLKLKATQVAAWPKPTGQPGQRSYQRHSFYSLLRKHRRFLVSLNLVKKLDIHTFRGL